MFYISHCYQQEEAAFFQSFLDIRSPGDPLPKANGHSLLRLSGAQIGPVSGAPQAALWLDPDTASWAVFEEEEKALSNDLGRGISYAALLLSLGREREPALRRLLGHLWQAGLLEVDGQSRWPADLFLPRSPFSPELLSRNSSYLAL